MTSAQIDMREMAAALKQLSKGSKRVLAKNTNQAIYDIVYETFAAIPPGEGQSAIDSERAKIRAYLNRQIGEAHNRLKSGKLGRRKARDRQLRARHLIMQSIYRKKGWEGLYGKRMKRVAGAFQSGKVSGAGYLQAPLSALISKLAKLPGLFRKNFSLYKDRLWKGGKFYPSGIHQQSAIPAAPQNEDQEAVVEWTMPVGDSQNAKVDQMYSVAVNGAIAKKMQHIENKIARDMQRQIDELTA